MNSASSRENSCGRSSCGKWPTPFEQLEAGCPASPRARPAVLDRDDRVGRAPDDQRRHRLGEVETVERADALAPGVEHRSHRLDERRRAPRRRRARRTRGRPRRGRSRPAGAGARSAARSTSPAPSTRGVREHRHHPLRPGQRRGTQQRVHLAAEAAAGDQDEALAALRELVGELHRDPAAERVADDRRAVVAEGDDRVADGARVGAERVVAARLRRLAVSEQVRGERPRWPSASCSIAGSHCSERPVIPWMRTISGPSPRRRKQTRWPWRVISSVPGCAPGRIFKLMVIG